MNDWLFYRHHEKTGCESNEVFDLGFEATRSIQVLV
jgi:hypothetical protein